MTGSIRADLTHGTAYGLATAGVAWSAVLAPTTPSASWGLTVALAMLVGASSTAFRGRLRRGVPVYPVALAALLLSGPLLSYAAVCACVLGGAVRITPRGREGLARIGLRLSRVTLAAVAAAGAFSLAGGSWGLPSIGSGWAGPIVAHAVTFAVARVALSALLELGLGRRGRLSGIPRRLAASVPACIVGSAVGWAAAMTLASYAWHPLGLSVLALVAVYSLRRLHVERATTCRTHEESMTYLRRSVTRALARIMEERDAQTQDHLRRVHRLSVGVGKALELSDDELETLGAAALLHDIGKVSVPDSILSKPGRLTPDEMERVKRHAVVGSEIVESLPFHHALAPLIRHHHERWDGDGYPDGLCGEEIPLGARVLSAIDCYDALTSERPYRHALSHREATTFLESEAGTMFDPEVIGALLDYLEARETADLPRRPQAVAEFAQAPPVTETESIDESAPRGSLAAAQRELETFYDISRAMGYGLNLDEFLTLAGCRLSSLVRYESMVVYFADHDAGRLRAYFAMGRAADKLRTLSVPIGERISGWTATQQRATIGRDHLTPLERDGTRSDLEEWREDPEVAPLRATLAAPLVADAGLVGVVSLYDTVDRGFTAEDKRTLVQIAGYIAQVAALEGDHAEIRTTSLTDPLTGVPNSRFLWLESAHRMVRPEEGFGLVAFRANGLDSLGSGAGGESVDRFLCELARRFAAGCRRSETLVRFGQDLFLVLTPECDSGELVQRWDELRADVERPFIDPRNGEARTVQVTAAHAAFPENGETLESLLEVLDRRLALASRRGRTVIPFRPTPPVTANSHARR